MSKLLAYLERYFDAKLWQPQGTKDAVFDDEDTTQAASSSNTSYRRKNHKKADEIDFKPSIAEGDVWNEEDVKKTFMENYGVSVRIVADGPVDGSADAVSSHFLFKYYVILQAKSTWLTDETGVLGDCRGTIMQCVKGVGWRVAARPFEKFFNQQEEACPVHTAASFNANVSDYQFVEKADGTMMVLWFRRSSATSSSTASPNGTWQWSTSTGLLADIRWVRAVTPFIHVASAIQEIAAELSETAMAAHNVVNEALLDQSRTYVFELCCKETQVITRYPTERIYLLGSIDTATGNVLTQDQLDAAAAALKVMRPTRCFAKEENITSLASTLAWIEEQSKPTVSNGRFGEYPEGFVVYYQDRPICKLKNRFYNDRHAFYAKDLSHMRNLMIERYFAGTTDDVLSFCPPPIVAFVEEMTVKVQDLFKVVVVERKKLVDAMTAMCTNVANENRVGVFSQLVANSESLRQNYLSKFFLKYKDIVIAPHPPSEAQLKENYLSWLDSNWKSLSDYWRSTKVPELVEEDKARDNERRTKQKKEM